MPWMPPKEPQPGSRNPWENRTACAFGEITTLPMHFPSTSFFRARAWPEKQSAIESVFGPEDWAKLQWAHWEGDLLHPCRPLADPPRRPLRRGGVRTGLTERSRRAGRTAGEWAPLDIQVDFTAEARLPAPEALPGATITMNSSRFRAFGRLRPHAAAGLRSDVTAEGSWNFCFDTNRDNKVRHYGIWENDTFDVRTLDGRRDPGWKWPRKQLLPDRKWPVRLPGSLQVQQ